MKNRWTRQSQGPRGKAKSQSKGSQAEKEAGGNEAAVEKMGLKIDSSRGIEVKEISMLCSGPEMALPSWICLNKRAAKYLSGCEKDSESVESL